MKYVITLTKEEEKALKNIMKNGDKYRIRQRAHAILLSTKKYPIDLLAGVFNVHRDTVSRWIDVWDERRFEGLYDAEKPGRPRTRGGRDDDDDDDEDEDDD